MRVAKKAIQIEPKVTEPITTLELEPIESAAEQSEPERQLRCAEGVSFMLNPYTQQVFTQAPCVPQYDGWVTAQLEAGKLVQC